MLQLNLATLGPLAARHAHLITQLAAHQYEPGVCRWSYQAMAAAMCRSMSPIKRLIRECASLGYITIERVRRGRGAINVYRIADRFFLRGKDSKLVTGKRRDSESVSSNESVAARAREKISKNCRPKIPRSAPDRRRTNRGFYGKLCEYLRDCEPSQQVPFWEATMDITSTAWWEGMGALPRELRGYVNQIWDRMRSSSWHRGRLARIAASETKGARWARRDAAWRHVDR